MDGAGQLQCVQQVEESMGVWVDAEKALVHYPGSEPGETTLRWTPVLGDSGCNVLGDVQWLAAIGNFQ